VHDEHLSVLEIARKIVEVMRRGRVTHVEWPEERRRIEIDQVRISSARLREITGWQPRYAFDQGLLKTRETLERLILQ
jgi:nucleoside-diphosphate-sugar epimerase